MLLIMLDWFWAPPHTQFSGKPQLRNTSPAADPLVFQELPQPLLPIHIYSRLVPLLAYKSQLLLLGPEFNQIEITGLQKVFHLATNALSHSAFFNLSAAGGPVVKSIRTQAKAAMVRTAASTLPQWPEWMRQLRVSAERHLSCNSVCAGNLTGVHWDSPALAWNLEQAWLGFPQDGVWARSGKLCAQLLDEKAHGKLLPGDSRYKQIQNEVYNILLDGMYPNNMGRFIHDKILNCVLLHKLTI